MRIVVAPDSFKGSLRAPEVAAAMAAGIRDALPEVETAVLPLGDGGEGTLDSLLAATGAEVPTLEVHDPIGRPVRARYLLLPDGATVFIEMAEAAGLSRLTGGELAPREASTFGVGQLLRAALATGRRRVLLGIGGSATNDGGAGMLQALGARLLDREGRDLPPGGAALAGLARIDLSGLRLPRDVKIVVACDVTNPLTGPDGAAAVYGPQKGATAEDIDELDAALSRFAGVAAGLGRDCRHVPGAGAAGGLGFACLAFLGARLTRGAGLVLDTVGFDRAIEGAALVMTGEGRIDRQTLAFGKTIAEVADRARRAGVPVIALAGSLHEEVRAPDYRAAGLASVHTILRSPTTLQQAMEAAPDLLRDAARRVFEVYLEGVRSSARLPLGDAARLPRGPRAGPVGRP